MNSCILFVSALGLTLAFAPYARAQNPNMMAPNGAAPVQGAPGVAATASPTDVVNIDAANLAQLPALLGRAGAISLGVSADQLEANPAAQGALINYVRGGGTVFLHTNAAQIFGYRTVAARQTTNRLVGQFYGRARAAVPFGTVPLLWNDDANPARGVVRAPGINRVFYTLRAGDDLVVDHPAGTPLLQISDSTLSRPLYAAAIAPYGAGFAVFTPDFIDQTRGDGAAFARNLLKLVGSARYVGVPQAAISSGDGLLSALAGALQHGGGQSAPLPGFGTDMPVAREGATPGVPVAGMPTNGAPNGAIMGGAPTGAAIDPAQQGPVLLLTRGEASAFGAALQNDPQGRGATALAILRARVALLNEDFQAAQAQLAIAERLAPNAGDIPFLRGVAATATSGFIGATTGDRVLNANLAANSFAVAGRVQSLFSGTSNGANNNPANANFYGDIASSQLGALGAQINRFSQVLALEPPLARVFGNGASAVTVRYFEGDTSLPFIATAINALTSSDLFRDSIDGQEILLFPTPVLYQNYRAASGLQGQTVPLPAAELGDVVDGRILMVTVPAARPAVIGPGGIPRIFPLRPTSANLLARFEAYALLDNYVGDSNQRVPGWMRLGLATVADLTVNGDTVSAQYNEELRRYSGLNALLSPRQFDGQIGNASLLAQAQATQLVRYFYTQFGGGNFAETIQRIGAGESVDNALLATTGLNEAQFFRAWSDAQFGAFR